MQLKGHKILFVCIPEKGHIHPLIGLAQELIRQGAELAFFCRRDISGLLSEINIEAQCFTSNDVLPTWFASQGEKFAQKQNDKEWMGQWLQTMLLDCIPHQTEALRKAVHAFQPQLIISDPMIYCTHIVSEETHIPWVAVATSINPLAPVTWNSDLSEAFDRHTPLRTALLGRNARFRLCDLISPWLNFVYFSEEYVPREMSQNDYSFHVGVSWNEETLRSGKDDFPYHLLKDDKKKILVSLGSQNFHHPEIFQAIIDATRGREDVQLILSIGSMNDSLLHDVPEETIIQSYLPQLELLKISDLFITHGGANSTLESLANAVPLCVMPLCNDQFFEARLIEHAQVGIKVNGLTPDVSEIKAAIEELLTQKKYKQRGKEIQNSLLSSGGIELMIQKIKTLMETKKPQIPTFQGEKKKEDFTYHPTWTMLY